MKIPRLLAVAADTVDCLMEWIIYQEFFFFFFNERKKRKGGKEFLTLRLELTLS